MTDEILVVGCGALATYFAARMAEAGIEVTVLGRWREGLDAMKSRGAGVEGYGFFPVTVANQPPKKKKYKTALVLVKGWQTQDAASDLSKCLADDGIAVTLQNGLDNDLILSNALGEDRVGRGVTTLGASLAAPGIARLGGEGIVILERRKRTNLPAEILRIANFEVEMKDDVVPSVWGKLVVNAAINPLTALLGVRNGALVDNPDAMVLMADLVNEAAHVSNKLRITLPFSKPMDAVVETLQRTSENESSMLQDIRRGAQTEIMSINGAIVQHGQKVHIPTPVNHTMVHMVNALTFGRRE